MAALVLGFSTAALADDEFYQEGARNTYQVFKPGTRTLIGTIDLKPGKKLVFNYGSDGIVLYGTYDIEEKHVNGVVVSKRLVANALDSQNTTIWVDSAVIVIDLTHAPIADLEKPTGVRVTMDVFIDGAKKPAKSTVDFIRE